MTLSRWVFGKCIPDESVLGQKNLSGFYRIPSAHIWV